KISEPTAVDRRRLILSLVGTECNEIANRKSRILAKIEIRREMAYPDVATRGRIQSLQPRHNLARRKHLNLKLVVGRLSHVFSHQLYSAIQCIERLRPAACHSPFELWHGLRDRRLGNGGRREADAGRLQEFATFPFVYPPFVCRAG